MKLIGAGFGRTGTLSLKHALEELGLGPCYHMVEVMKNKHHVPAWVDAVEHKPVDWKALFQGFESTVDWPGCTFYKELMAVYPDAKVLLSVRDPEKWYESTMNTIYGFSRGMATSWMRFVIPALKPMGRMINGLIWQGTFQGKFEDKAHALAVFNRHIEEVKQHVPPERLLVFDVKQGWEPLCAFLGVPVPSTPFPRMNDTASMQKRMKRMKQVPVAVAAIAAILIGLVVAFALRR